MKEILYDWGGINVWLFHAVNDIHFGLLDKFMLLGTEVGEHVNFPIYLALLTLVALTVIARTPAQDAARHQAQTLQWMSVIAVFSVAYSLDGLLLDILKPLLDFPRPPLALPPDSVHVVGIAEFHHSLPSGHSSFAMMSVASLWPILNRRWRVAGVLAVLWVGCSRVSLGMHFPADVLAGFLSSLAVVLLVYTAIQALTRRLAR